MAAVLPFPSACRRSFILRHAEIIASLSRDGGERHLRRQLQIQAEAMARRGIAPALIDDDQQELAAAIRSQLLRLGVVRGSVA